MKRSSFVLIRYAVIAVLAVAWLGAVAVAGAYVYIAPSLPSAEAMRRVELQVPMRIYSRSGQLISQIGEKRLIPVTFEQIPERVRQAVLAAEDDRFFSHSGVDWAGFTRAVFKNLAGQSQGGSTITQQAARNMFLTLDKTVRRKATEIFLTFRMERQMTKEQILATYLNVIFFGQRSYGIAAAAETFYGKRLEDLTVSEAATLAGIIQLPARYNPVANPQLAGVRRAYVLRRMQELGYIDAATAEKARQEPIASRGFAPLYDIEAPYVAELARQELVKRYGAGAVNAGYKVFTSVDGRLQTAANRALRLGLIEYDRRHGYRGPLAQVKLPAPLERAKLDALLGGRESVGIMLAAVITRVEGKTAQVHIRGRGEARIEWDGLSWARPVKNGRMGAAPKTAADVVAPGDVVHVVADRRGNALLAQVPQIQGAFVALDPQDGGIIAMVGGFDYYANQFNRVTQARRQPGSGFKPFLYSAALENGLTPASIVLDTPIVVDDADVEGQWRPENSTGEFGGPTPLRQALYRSRNLVSIRILRDIGIDTAIRHASLFGFDPATMPRNLTLALGTLAATPLQIATGYATLANGGYHVEPYFIDRIENAAGEVLFQQHPLIVCPTCEPAPIETTLQPDDATFGSSAPTDLADVGPSPAELEASARRQALIERRAANVPPGLAALAETQGGRGFLPPERAAPRVISAANAWLISDILADVIKRGTGVRARVLNRNDISGKTGTSNDSRDVWFNGYNPKLVASTWLGFDEERSLGDREEGSSTAVPVWVHFMREALRGVPDVARPPPPGIVRMRVSARTGAQADPLDPDATTESFLAEHLPPAGVPGGSRTGPGIGGPTDPLF